MRFGPVTFPKDAGKHSDRNHLECSGRTFRVFSVGVRGILTNFVVCLSCRRELEALEHRLVEPQRSTFHDLVMGKI